MIIALTGMKGSGKDHFADWLVDTKGYKKIAFADCVKTHTELVFPWCKADSTHEEKDTVIYHPQNVLYHTPREIWRIYSEGVKAVDPHYFFRNTREIIKLMSSMNNNKVVITDMRFMHEYEWIKREDYITLKLITDEDNHPDYVVDPLDRSITKFETDLTYRNPKTGYWAYGEMYDEIYNTYMEKN